MEIQFAFSISNRGEVANEGAQSRYEARTWCHLDDWRTCNLILRSHADLASRPPTSQVPACVDLLAYEMRWIHDIELRY